MSEEECETKVSPALKEEPYVDPLESNEPIKVRVHSTPGQSTCESCEG